MGEIHLTMKLNPRISVLGLGYVGLPLALALGENYPLIGYDTNPRRIEELSEGIDRTAEVSGEVLTQTKVRFTGDVQDLRDSELFIIAVPTPVDQNSQPDLTALKGASASVAGVMREGSIVVVESTVYPGVTENVCGTAIEKISGLRSGKDFFLGYSPERINPGDSLHTVDKIVKVVAGQTPAISKKLAEIYGSMNGGKVFLAKDIKTAEAAKVIENAQRDINIAFINEITKIFQKLEISTYDVLEAANTKWNFLPFTPGLVGGHCIGVDPYYLAFVANEAGFNPAVVLAGRSINDSMAEYVAVRIDDQLDAASRVLVLGLTFKENVPDLRNSKVADVVRHLSAKGHEVQVHDPLADWEEADELYGIEILSDFPSDFDCVVGCVAHNYYRAFDFGSVLKTNGLIADLKGMWREFEARDRFRYWSL